MIVCSCNLITSDAIKDCIGPGPGCPRTPGQVQRCLGCTPQCGRCAPTIRSMIAEAPCGRDPSGCREDACCAHPVPAPWQTQGSLANMRTPRAEAAWIGHVASTIPAAKLGPPPQQRGERHEGRRHGRRAPEPWLAERADGRQPVLAALPHAGQLGLQ
ncbi:MAG TPA: (2Fe-2S)-binding protein [Salinarimonas sp.]|nr:(2Fe-2S)-binding protein [Salinarimonas sp.]